jgi:alkylation response protein AidB-like acyl-CoA dehydrogenase
MISFGPTDEQELIRETVRAFAQDAMAPAARDADEKEQVPADFLERSWELGLVNSAVPESYGGGGLERSPVTSALVLEELAAGCAGLAVAALAPSLFVNPLLDFGTDEQKREYLPLFTTSRFHAATLAWHEPSFSFDATNLQTIAEPKGKGFRLTGRKRMVPLGDRASHVLVVARGGAREGLDGLEAFIVPRDARGLSISPEKTMGLRAVPWSAVELQGVEVPAAARLGGERGIDGRRLVNTVRAGSAAIALGVARAVMELAVPYAKQRIAFGEPIAKKQAIAFMLAEMQIEVNAMRWMVWKTASQLEHASDATRQAQLTQVYVAREAMKIADNGLQVFGGHGFIRDYPVEMWYRNARSITVLEGAVAL